MSKKLLKFTCHNLNAWIISETRFYFHTYKKPLKSVQPQFQKDAYNSPLCLLHCGQGGQKNQVLNLQLITVPQEPYTTITSTVTSDYALQGYLMGIKTEGGSRGR